MIVFCSYLAPPALHSFPTRRSSDLDLGISKNGWDIYAYYNRFRTDGFDLNKETPGLTSSAYRANTFQTKIDRKSTRLNSSHVRISYAASSLKKKTDSNHAAPNT